MDDPLKVKESEPVADQYWENYAREIKLEKEVAEMGGVEKIASGEVPVPAKEAKEMGIRPTVEITTPIAKVVDFSVRGVALSDDQLGIGLKKPTSSGFRWLVEWFIYQLLKAHYWVKKVRGKVLRQKSPPQTSAPSQSPLPVPPPVSPKP